MEDEEVQFASFEKAPEFFEILSKALDVDLQQDPSESQEETEIILFNKLTRIIDEYQEQIYLLDPFLERMVTPVVEVFKIHATQYTTNRRSGKDAPYSSIRLTRLSLLLYSFIKCRGRKTIVNFFPHQVADLSIAMDYLYDGPAQIPSQWPLRYIVLLWLSLICMIPFDLSKFDDDVMESNDNVRRSTARKLDALANGFLKRPGLDRDAAAVLLSKLYTRKDTATLLAEFLTRSIDSLGASPEISQVIGILHVLCEITKSGVAAQVAPNVDSMYHVIRIIEAEPSLMNNSLVRKYRVKLEGRLAVSLLPLARPMARRVRELQSSTNIEENVGNGNDSHDVNVPVAVESGISMLLNNLQDKDTTVRYSAAKHLARVSSRLPLAFTEQVLESISVLFEEHSTPTGRIEDMQADAEITWHGACLACAETARRGLISAGYLPQFLELLKKALLFDIRKGSHSVGSSVRDAASYALWSLARSQDVEEFAPHALSLSQRMVSVSLYDREVQIRRAASAAFQENVGRMDVFPHGIDIIRKADFFSVGIRKNAFLVAAPQVAEHLEYRSSLIDHIINQTIVHWDPSMRVLGAQSLRAICELDLEQLGPNMEERLLPILQSVDTNAIHGGLICLSEIAASYAARGNLERNRLNIFVSLERLPSSLIQKYHYEKILEATCLVIANSISPLAIDLDPSPTSRWRTIVEQGLWHREANVQEAAARAMRSCSRLIDCSKDVEREFARRTPVRQQSVARCLGFLAYDCHDHAVRESLACLLDGVNPVSSTFTSNVEARRNCYSAMTEILGTLGSKIMRLLDPPTVDRIIRACMLGLDDYTTDERGDVGSWIRMACIRGLHAVVEVLFRLAPSLEQNTFEIWFPSRTYQEMLGAILKQGVERLDNVRRQTGDCFLRLLKLGLPKIEEGDHWQIHGSSLFQQLLLNNEEVGWNEGQWLFPRAVQFLKISEYRKMVLQGLVSSIGSKTDSTQRHAATSFTELTGSLQVVTDNADDTDLLTITNELLHLAQKNFSSNSVIIPVFQTLDLLLDAGILEKLAEDRSGIQALNDILDLSTKNVDRLRNMQRILTSMRIVNGMLTVPCLFKKAIAILPHFLLHARPKVRTDTAENLYFVIQAKNVGTTETDEAEEILLETDWSASIDDLKAKVANLVSFLTT